VTQCSLVYSTVISEQPVVTLELTVFLNIHHYLEEFKYHLLLSFIKNKYLLLLSFIKNKYHLLLSFIKNEFMIFEKILNN